jgi:hypothetical protein
LNGKEPAKGADDNYVTDAEKVVIGNTSWTNSWNVTLAWEDYLSLAGQQITANPIDLDNLSASGTPDGTTFLRWDNTWATPPWAAAGITRTVVVTSWSITLGTTASVDYLYFVAWAHTLSMPSPNTNRYTVKNNHSANITIDTVWAETIEWAASISIAPEESVDIASDGTNRFII